ncbi:MAG: RnfABCDGE type electron transport complex subunit D [Candidatus Palauibacterales bacterium]|nr:RnfABCDGE type electron transport complex subunit D [Candidatus Palauibacterales bacterium]
MSRGGGGPGPAGREADLRIAPSPHIRSPDSTPRIMWTVVATLVPVVAAAVWFFGVAALLVTGAATFGAVATEWAFDGRDAVSDGSGVITGVLLGLTLPAGIPLWMAALGGAFGMGFGKLIFGGLGQNVFNPALLGRAFLQASFPTAITTWPAVEAGRATFYQSNLALPFLQAPEMDAATAATPLGLMKFEGETTELWRLLLGNTGGSLGETAGLVILICGGYLALRNYLDWRIPVSIFATVAALSGVLHLIDPAAYPGPLFMIFSGGLILGAVYMATDMVTSPVTAAGAWLFGIGIGVITVLVRLWGGLPEGIMYAILFMNALVPFLDRVTLPAPFGAGAGGAAGGGSG